MKYIWWIVGITGAATLAVVGVKLYKQFSLLADTCVKFTGYKLVSLTRDKVQFTLNFALKNLSDIALTVNGYSFDVFINNIEVSTVSSANVVQLPANGEATLSATIAFNPSNLNSTLFSSILLNFNQSVIRLKGTVAVKAVGISANKLPVDMSSKFTEMLPGAPSASKC